MHVAIAAHDLYPDPGSGGSGRYVYETGRRLVERGHDVSVLTRRRSALPSRETVAGMAVYRYDLHVADRSAPAIARQLPRSLTHVAAHVAAIESGSGPDVLSLQGPVTGPLLSALADDSIPRSCTLHSPWPTEYRLRTRSSGRNTVRRALNAQLRRVVEGRLLSSCDEVIVLSAFMREKLRETYPAAGEPVVIPGGVDLERYAPSAGVATLAEPVGADGGETGAIAPDEPLGDDSLLPGDPAFLTVRRLSERMGHGLLLAAFAAVRERHPDARLYLAGDGPLRGRLERTAARLGIDDAATFLGYVSDADLPATYAAADVFVLPTTELEGFGLATLEALASGTPVVATPVGATPEVIGGLAAFEGVRAPVLAPSVERDALAAVMAEWAAMTPADRVTAGQACRRYVARRYPWNRTVSTLVGRYRDLAR